jgi:NADPH-dependent ferric siderophore reductase
VYGVGSTVASVTLEDQFATAHTLDDRVSVVLFARDMEGGGLIKAVLAQHPDALAANRAIYVADISGMPALIARLSAIPKMKERPYPTLLDRDGTATAAFPSEPEKATLMRLSSREVTEIRFVASENELRAALGVRGE